MFRPYFFDFKIKRHCFPKLRSSIHPDDGFPFHYITFCKIKFLCVIKHVIHGFINCVLSVISFHASKKQLTYFQNLLWSALKLVLWNNKHTLCTHLNQNYYWVIKLVNQEGKEHSPLITGRSMRRQDKEPEYLTQECHLEVMASLLILITNTEIIF